MASRTFYRHSFRAPHIDAVESFIDYRVPPEIVTPLAQFDGIVVVEEANFLTLNLAQQAAGR